KPLPSCPGSLQRRAKEPFDKLRAKGFKVFRWNTKSLRAASCGWRRGGAREDRSATCLPLAEREDLRAARRQPLREKLRHIFSEENVPDPQRMPPQRKPLTSRMVVTGLGGGPGFSRRSTLKSHRPNQAGSLISW